MGIFDIFKTPEEQYYKKFKKIIKKVNGKKISVESLRIRVMTINNVIDTRKKEYRKSIKEMEEGTAIIDLEKDDAKIKTMVLLRILNEAEQDFIKGVKMKYKGLDDREIPSSFQACNFYAMSVEMKMQNRGISSEEIKNFDQKI